MELDSGQHVHGNCDNDSSSFDTPPGTSDHDACPSRPDACHRPVEGHHLPQIGGDRQRKSIGTAVDPGSLTDKRCLSAAKARELVEKIDRAAFLLVPPMSAKALARRCSRTSRLLVNLVAYSTMGMSRSSTAAYQRG